MKRNEMMKNNCISDHDRSKHEIHWLFGSMFSVSFISIFQKSYMYYNKFTFLYHIVMQKHLESSEIVPRMVTVIVYKI